MTEPNVMEPPEKKHGWREKTLEAAGISYMFGDAAMAIAGKARGKDGWSTVKGAAIWFLGGVAAAKWGHPNHEVQLKIQAAKLEDYMKKQGVEIPDDARARAHLLKQKTFWEKVNEFLYQHPSEMLNLAYAIGASVLLHGAVKTPAQREAIIPKRMTKNILLEMNQNFWIGALVLAGSMTGLLVKEDPDARKKAEGKGILQRAYAAVAEKPLRVSGTLYGLNNIFLAANAGKDFKLHTEGKYSGQSVKPHYASITQLAAYIFSNVMLFLSRRDRTSEKKFDARDINQLEEAAAHIVVSQPLEKQNKLLADVSEYMASQKGITLKAPEIAAQLSQRIAAITEERLQPSVNHVKWAHREEARQHAPHADMAPLAGR